MSPKWLNAVVITCSLALATGSPTLAQQGDSLPEPLATDAAKASYGLGFQTGMQATNGQMEFDIEGFILGLKDAASKAKPRLTNDQIVAAMKSLEEAALARQKPLADKNKKDGAAFIAKYKKLAGVKAMPNGIHYKILKAGTGASPSPTDTVKVHYQGRTVDGKEFDSSYKRKQPAIFPLNGVIRGWTETVQKMKVGGKWQVVIPSDLAYGAAGSPPVIGPDSVLVFDIELLGIEESGGR